MQKALTGIVLLFMFYHVHAQTWLYTSPNVAYFNYSGNKVGIGTATPSQILHISGAGAVQVEPLIEATGDGFAMLDFKSNGKMWNWAKRPSTENDAFTLYYHSGSAWVGPFLTCLPNGNMSLGGAYNNTPQAKLDILTPGVTSIDALRIYKPDDAGKGWLAFSQGNGTNTYRMGQASWNVGVAMYLGGADPTNPGTLVQKWDQNGRVGIGTSNTSDANYKLFVETGIRTRKITVDLSNWPDYVFHPGYTLPSLPSVAAYIKANHHLPDMPSADSVAKNGVDLGSNQAQLLKKIEELTLYVIQQQQQIDALKEDVKKCQNR